MSLQWQLILTCDVQKLTIRTIHQIMIKEENFVKCFKQQQTQKDGMSSNGPLVQMNLHLYKLQSKLSFNCFL